MKDTILNFLMEKTEAKIMPTSCYTSSNFTIFIDSDKCTRYEFLKKLSEELEGKIKGEN